jgi:prevent-host-death family protein
MRQINIHEAKTQLSKLIAAGEEVIIARYGEPVAKLVPIRPPAAKRTPGSARGRFTVPPEFFEPLPEELLNSFEPQ